MISYKLQLLLLLFSLFFLFFVISMIRKYKLDLKYALLWVLVNIFFIFISIAPQIIAILSSIIGIEVPSNAVFLIGIIFLYLIVFSLTVALSRTSFKLKELIQEVGILKNQIEKMKKYKE
jgi:hypothetical protein